MCSSECLDSLKHEGSSMETNPALSLPGVRMFFLFVLPLVSRKMSEALYLE